MKKFVIISVVLIIIYVLVKRPSLYTGLISSVTSFASKGVSTLTKGKSS